MEPLTLPHITEIKIEQCRPEVIAFAKAMEARLRANDHKGGWGNCRIGWLYDRAVQEFMDLGEELGVISPNPEKVLHEAADAANFLMMVADISNQPSNPPHLNHKTETNMQTYDKRTISRRK